MSLRSRNSRDSSSSKSFASVSSSAFISSSKSHGNRKSVSHRSGAANIRRDFVESAHAENAVVAVDDPSMSELTMSEGNGKKNMRKRRSSQLNSSISSSSNDFLHYGNALSTQAAASHGIRSFELPTFPASSSSASSSASSSSSSSCSSSASSSSSSSSSAFSFPSFPSFPSFSASSASGSTATADSFFLPQVSVDVSKFKFASGVSTECCDNETAMDEEDGEDDTIRMPAEEMKASSALFPAYLDAFTLFKSGESALFSGHLSVSSSIFVQVHSSFPSSPLFLYFLCKALQRSAEAEHLQHCEALLDAAVASGLSTQMEQRLKIWRQLRKQGELVVEKEMLASICKKERESFNKLSTLHCLLLCQHEDGAEYSEKAMKALRDSDFEVVLSKEIIAYQRVQPALSMNESVKQAAKRQVQKLRQQLESLRLFESQLVFPKLSASDSTPAILPCFTPLCCCIDSALPPLLLSSLQSAFSPSSVFWSEHRYHNPSTGFFSYLYSLSSPPSTVLEHCFQMLHAHALHFYPKHARSARFIEWWVHSRPHSNSHQLHFDSDDEGRNGIRHPVLGSVLFVDGVVGGPTLTTNQTLKERRLASQGFLVYPKANRFMLFDGKMLHGVLPGRGVAPQRKTAAEAGAVEGTESKDANAKRAFKKNRAGVPAVPIPEENYARRMTLMCAFWSDIECRPRSDGRPGSSQPYPTAASHPEYSWMRLFDDADSVRAVKAEAEKWQKSGNDQREEVEVVGVRNVWAPVLGDGEGEKAAAEKRRKMNQGTLFAAYDRCFQG